jgi:thiopurine S-methyltransferase
MDLEFWIERWNRGQIGFHRDEINPALVQGFPQLGLETEGHILVPLCGKSRDLLYLQGLGYRVTGIELSPIAIRDFWMETGITPETRSAPPLTFTHGDGITLIEGDFFKVTPQDLDPPDAVYDRAALIAMPPELRSAYVDHLVTLAQGAPILLVTLEYDQTQMSGPPFAVLGAEIQQRFGKTHRIDVIHSQAVIDDNASIKARGVKTLHETVYRISPN